MPIEAETVIMEEKPLRKDMKQTFSGRRTPET